MLYSKNPQKDLLSLANLYMNIKKVNHKTVQRRFMAKFNELIKIKEINYKNCFPKWLKGQNHWFVLKIKSYNISKFKAYTKELQYILRKIKTTKRLKSFKGFTKHKTK